MKHSIRTRLILILTSLIIMTISVCLIMNVAFLASYYEKTKTETMGTTYQKVIEICDEYNDSDDQDINALNESLDRIGANNNVNLYVFQVYFDSGRLVYTPVLQYPQRDDDRSGSGSVYNGIYEYIDYYINGKELREKEILYNGIENGKNYDIYKVYDKSIESNYIELISADEGSWVYMRSNYQSMTESVNISNKFLTYVGILTTLISVVLMFFVGRSFTKPILKLSDIAKRMSDLDFDAKYVVERNDEIGDLGKSMNILSEKLQNTISELKSANNELETDIQRKIQIDEMRQEFLSNVSHELKTPIALIQGYAEGLHDNINDDAESREFYCDVIMDEAKKMNKMVKKLLSLNQIEFGANQIQFERFDLVDLIRSVLDSTDILFKQKSVMVHFEEKEPVCVWADEFYVEEVITNYISNALNHVSNPKIIEIKIIKKGDVVRVAVFNTGDNIPVEELDKIWIKFYKVDKARTREYGGNGIGLSIVKAIMTSLNKECGVINHKNGVEFWFEVDIKNEL